MLFIVVKIIKSRILFNHKQG